MIRSLIDTPCLPGEDRSARMWRILIACAIGHWTLKDVLVLADKPGMAHARTRRDPNGIEHKRPIQGPGGTLTVIRDDWRRAVNAAMRMRRRQGDDPQWPAKPTGRTPSPQACCARPWCARNGFARGGGPADLRVLAALCLYAVRACTTAIQADIRRLAIDTGIGGRPHAARSNASNTTAGSARRHTRKAGRPTPGKSAEPQRNDDHFCHARSQMNMPPAQQRDQLIRRINLWLNICSHDAFTGQPEWAPRRQPIRHPPPPRIRHSRSSPHPPSGAGRAGAIARHPRTNPGQGTALRARTARLGLVAQRTRLDESPRGNPSPPRNHAPTGHAQGDGSPPCPEHQDVGSTGNRPAAQSVLQWIELPAHTTPVMSLRGERVRERNKRRRMGIRRGTRRAEGQRLKSAYSGLPVICKSHSGAARPRTVPTLDLPEAGSSESEIDAYIIHGTTQAPPDTTRGTHPEEFRNMSLAAWHLHPGKPLPANRMRLKPWPVCCAQNRFTMPLL